MRAAACARRFAATLGHGAELRGALLRLDATNRSSQNVDPLFSAYHHSHPPLLERLRALDRAVDARTSAESAAGKKAS